MRIVATNIAKGHDGIPLPETTVSYETGRVTVVEAEVGDRPVVLALILSGRMRPDAGTITLDGADDPALLRERVALVDAPEVSAPAADLPLSTVIREELLYAGRSTSRATIAQTLADAGATAYAKARIDDVPPAIRLRLLAELAAFRRGVEALVITSPDRHGGDPRDWLAVATDLAARDFAVAVVCGAPSAEIIRPLLPVSLHSPATPEHPDEPQLPTPEQTAAPLPSPTPPAARPSPHHAAPADRSDASGVVGVLGQRYPTDPPERSHKSPRADQAASQPAQTPQPEGITTNEEPSK